MARNGDCSGPQLAENVTWWPATSTVTTTARVGSVDVTVMEVEFPALSDPLLSLRVMGPDFDAVQATGPPSAVSVTSAAGPSVNDLGAASRVPIGTGAVVVGGAFVVVGGGFGGGVDTVGVGAVVVTVGWV